MEVEMKKVLILFALLALFLAPAAPAQAASTAPVNEGVCAPGDTGKIDVDGSIKTITVTAPEGYLVSGYCVKAGSIVQGDGPEYVEVDPSQASVTFGHSTGKDISHYSATFVPKPTPTPTPTTPTPTPTETSATPTPTETSESPTPTPTETSATPAPSDPTEPAPAPPAPPALAETGSTSGMVGLGLGLLALGAGAVWLATRRTGAHG
jgi:hypothetical protein